MIKPRSDLPDRHPAPLSFPDRPMATIRACGLQDDPNAFKYSSEPCFWIDVVHLGRLDEGIGYGGGFAACL